MDISFDVKDLLEDWTDRVNDLSFVENDPVQFPRRYSLMQDIEIAGLLSSVIAWGKRSIILHSGDKMFSMMGCSPYDYIMSSGFESLGTANVHRTFFEPDLKILCKGLQHCYRKYDTLQDLFLCGSSEGEDLWKGIVYFKQLIAEANDGVDSCHISNPLKNSACKRMFLFFRWMVRQDRIVDLGIWNKIKPSSLYIPLDVHVGDTARKIGILKRKQNDRKSVEELTSVLRGFCPEDPVRYDFALFGIGESGAIKDL